MSSNQQKTMSDSNKRRALGRGLGALLPNAAPNRTVPQPGATSPSPSSKEPANKTFASTIPREGAKTGSSIAGKRAGSLSGPSFVNIETVHPAPDQPRRLFPPQELSELAQSIKEHGIIQPLIVRKRSQGGYILIAGERRWRAAQSVGLDRVPVVVQEVSNKDCLLYTSDAADE